MKPLAEIMASFQQKYPDVSFHIYTAIADDVKERLENGTLDMGLLLEPVEISRYHYVRMPLKEKWQVLMRRDSRLAKREKIRPEDLVGVPLIMARRQSVRNQLENWFGYDREKLRIVSTCNISHYNQSVMVESGIGVALVMDFPVIRRPYVCGRLIQRSRAAVCWSGKRTWRSRRCSSVL